MKKKLKTIICVCMISFFTFTSISAAELKIGVLNIPPYYIVQNGEFSGIYITFLNKLMKETKFKYSFNEYPPKRLYQSLAKGKVDIWLGPKVSSIEKDVLLHPTPINEIIIRSYAIGDTPLPTKISDLNMKQIITISGYNYGGLIDYINNPENQIFSYNSKDILLAFKMLEKKRASYLINYKEPSEQLLKKYPIKDIKYSDIKKIGAYLHISKKTNNADTTLKTIIDAYEKIKQ